MNQRGAAVRADDEIRNHAEQVAAFAIAPEVVRHQAQARHEFHVRVDRSAGARLGEVLLRDGIEELHRALDARNFKVDLGTRIEGDLGDDVRVNVGSRDAVDRRSGPGAGRRIGAFSGAGSERAGKRRATPPPPEPPKY